MRELAMASEHVRVRVARMSAGMALRGGVGPRVDADRRRIWILSDLPEHLDAVQDAGGSRVAAYGAAGLAVGCVGLGADRRADGPAAGQTLLVTLAEPLLLVVTEDVLRGTPRSPRR